MTQATKTKTSEPVVIRSDFLPLKKGDIAIIKTYEPYIDEEGAKIKTIYKPRYVTRGGKFPKTNSVVPIYSIDVVAVIRKGWKLPVFIPEKCYTIEEAVELAMKYRP